MDEAAIVAELRNFFGEKTLLSPEDIAPHIRRTPKAQANLRSLGVFPIPLTYVSGKPYVTIYALAAWLAGTSNMPGGGAVPPLREQAAAKIEEASEPSGRTPKKSTGQGTTNREAGGQVPNRPPLGPMILPTD